MRTHGILGFTLIALAGTGALAAQPAPLTAAEVEATQARWGGALVEIGALYASGGDYKAAGARAVDTLYGYDEGTVLFKPTRAEVVEFRLTEPEAVSYFVTGVDAEDHGFALAPWTAVRFENAGIILHGDEAIAMGNYYFTPADGSAPVKVDFTMGFIRAPDGGVLINLHHSSLPYTATH